MMIQAINLSKRYGAQVALNLQELQIPKGQVFGLVGNNGAGKTTFFNLILDLIQPTSGYVLNAGENVAKTTLWKEHTAAFIDESFLIGYLTPEEYFNFVGELRGMKPKDVKAFLMETSSIFTEDVFGKNKYIRDLSKGNQKKVGILAALIGNPDLVILDEPFANLDPTTQVRMKKLIEQVSQHNKTTILISSHDLAHVTEISDRIVLLEGGLVKKDLLKTAETLEELADYFAIDEVVSQEKSVISQIEA